MVGLMGLCGEVVFAMGRWIVDAIRFQKIYGLNSAESGEMARSAGFWVGLVGLMGLCGCTAV